MLTSDLPAPRQGALRLELNGINVIPAPERKGHPRSLFWPWCAANISVLAISYGALLLGFGLSWRQAAVAGVLGTVASFLLCGFISLAGKRGSAPTMVLSRAAFGVGGNRLPALLSWLLLVGWEVVLVALASLATSTVLTRLGTGGGTPAKILGFVVVVVLVVGAGALGFDVLMRLQAAITVVTAVLTVGYVALTIQRINWHAVSSAHAGTTQEVIGATIFAVTALGLGWTNSAADYSRYLPRRAPGAAVVGWTTFGASVAPVVLISYGVLLAGSSSKLSEAIGADPIGALTTVLPTWYLVPFAVVAILGLVGGAVLDIYSSGLTLLSLGLPVPRYAAACVDGVITVGGTIYLVFSASNFIGPFEGFLTTLGVPIAAWCGVFLADIALRRRPYADDDLFRADGRYGQIRWGALALVLAGTAIGFGLVTNTAASWLSWQGYLLTVTGLGGKSGSWAAANLGVVVALAVAFAGWLVLGASSVRRQERAVPHELAAAAG